MKIRWQLQQGEELELIVAFGISTQSPFPSVPQGAVATWARLWSSSECC